MRWLKKSSPLEASSRMRLQAAMEAFSKALAFTETAARWVGRTSLLSIREKIRATQTTMAKEARILPKSFFMSMRG